MAYVPPHLRRKRRRRGGEEKAPATPAPATPARATLRTWVRRRETAAAEVAEEVSVVNIAFVNLQDAKLKGKPNDPKVDLVKELVRFHDGVFIAEVLLDGEIPSFINRIQSEVRRTHDFFKTQYLPQGPEGLRHGLFFIGKKSLFETDFYSSALAEKYVNIPQLRGKERILAVKHTAGNFLICGVHLKQGGGARDKQLRTEAVQTILTSMGSQNGVIIGDFNVNDEGAERLLGSGFEHDEANVSLTRGKVDHYFSRGVSILSGVMPDDYRGVERVSDHPSIRIRIES